MSNWFWRPVDYNHEISSLGSKSSVFVQDLSGRHLLFFHDGTLTNLLIISTGENRLVVEAAKKIQAEHSILRISGNSMCILMLDVTGGLFHLQWSGNAPKIFNSSNADKLIDNDTTLSWHKLHKINNCLAMTGISNAVAFLYHNESLYSALLKSAEIENDPSRFSKERLNYFDCGGNYFLTILKGGIANAVCNKILGSLSSMNEILVIVGPTQILFSMPTSQGQIVSKPYAVDLQAENIITVMGFDKKSCIMIACKSGKIVCMKFNNSSKTFQIKHIWLPSKLFTIIGCEFEEIVLLYSDLNNFHMAALNDQYELRILKVSLNVRGIRHFVKVNNSILAITRNCCLYETVTDLVDDHEVVELTADQLLNHIYEMGIAVERLNEEIQVKEDLIQALEISKITDIRKHIHVIVKKSEFKLENKTDYVLKKDVWRLKLELKNYPKKYMEIRILQNDIPPGHSESFKWTGASPDQLEIALICEANDTVIFINLEVTSEGNTSWIENDMLDDTKKFLKENCTYLSS